MLVEMAELVMVEYLQIHLYIRNWNQDISKYLRMNHSLPDRIKPVPYMVVGDDAFLLKTYLLKPYPSRNLQLTQRIFNYRLLRVRRIIERGFGILTSGFAVFQKSIPLEPEKVEKVVLASCVLHNFLRLRPLSRNIYSPPQYIDRENCENGLIIEAEWRQVHTDNLRGLSQQGSNRSTVEAREMREEICDYVNTNGQVPCQWNAV